MGNALVVCEQDEWILKRVSLELVSEARRLGSRQVIAVMMGRDDEAAASLAQHGADAIVALEGDAAYRAGCAQAVAEVATESGAALILVPASSRGKELAPLIAARLDTGVASEVTAIEMKDDGGLLVTRPMYAGKVIATVEAAPGRPHVVTVRPNVFAVGEADSSRNAQVATRPVPAPEAPGRVRVKQVVKPEAGELDVAEAQIIVSGGRGMKGPENFAMLEELARLLGGAVGASRAAVDAGWQPHSRQVGQTGKTVSPRLYIACGISGAVQHLAGMRTSRTIVAINTDPQAPIFKRADYGIVGDLFKVVPALIEEVKKSA